MPKEVDFKSPIHYDIVSHINSVFSREAKFTVSATDHIYKAKEEYGGKWQWRITNKNYEQMNDPNLMTKVKREITAFFPDLVKDKLIKFGHPMYTKDVEGNPMSSIVINIEDLPDNRITALDFLAPDWTALYKIEDRMYRDDNDLRSQQKRLEDIRWTLFYEPRIANLPLVNITNLQANHPLDVFTLATTTVPDFTGVISGNSYQIEAKSTSALGIGSYADTDQWRTAFIDYLDNYFKSGVRIHNADYILLVLKNYGKIFCINTKNTSDFWLAGEI